MLSKFERRSFDACRNLRYTVKVVLIASIAYFLSPIHSMTSWPAKNGIPLPQRHFQQMLVCCVVAAICTLFAAPAWASGCHDLRVGATVHGLDPVGNPLP